MTGIKYRADIDGLRAIAVIAVILFHLFPKSFEGGFVGVDIFFVISGFLISSNIFRGLDRKTFNIVDFFKRRIVRIFPPLIAMIFVVLVAGWFLLFSDEFQKLGEHVSFSSFFASNIILARESGYFDIAAELKPLLHLWSLGIEEQFYIFLPLLLIILWKKKKLVYPFLFFFFVLFFVLNIFNTNPTKNFYYPQYRFWELLAGSLLAYTQISFKNNIERIHVFAMNFLSLIGFLLIISSILLIPSVIDYPKYIALAPVCGSVLLILGGQDSYINKFFLSNQWMVKVGLISYPLYLWHWPLISFFRISQGHDLNSWHCAIIVFLTILLSVLTYRYIEMPIKNKQNDKIGIYLLVTLLVFGGFGFLIRANKGFPERVIAQQANQLNYIVDFKNYRDCKDDSEFKNMEINYCYMRNDGVFDAVIVGDSHAEDKFHGIFKQDLDRKWLLLGNTSCPPVIDIEFESDRPGCTKKMQSIFQWIKKQNNIQVLMLSFFGMYFEELPFAADHNSKKWLDNKFPSAERGEEKRIEAFHRGIENTLNLLLPYSYLLVLPMDIPELPFMPRDCIRNATNCILKRERMLERQKKYRILLNQLKSNYSNLHLYDSADFFCHEQDCLYKKEEGILYRDSHHLTFIGSDLYAKHFLDWLKKITHN